MPKESEITKVQLVIRRLAWELRDIRKDKDLTWAWVNKFLDTLMFQDLEEDPNDYALAILAEAKSFNEAQKRKQQMRWVKNDLAQKGIENPTQDQLDERWLEMYGFRDNEGHEINEDHDDNGKDYDQETGNTDDKHNNRGADAVDGDTTEACVSGESRRNRASATSAPRTLNGRKKQFKAPTTQELYDFAASTGLDEADARDCWEMCESRQWADRDGMLIQDWKGFVKGFCNSRKKKRSA